MLRLLALDDEGYRHKAFDRAFDGYEITHCYSVDDAIAAVEREPPFDAMTLDHQLGFNYDDYPALAKTGSDFAKYLATVTDKRPRAIFIHSWNHGGALDMRSILTEAGYRHVKLTPFAAI